MHKFLFTFQTTHQALSAEKKMRKGGGSCRLIPTPSEIFAECGFSLEIEMDEEDFSKAGFENQFSYAGCYLIAQSESQRKIYEQIHP